MAPLRKIVIEESFELLVCINTINIAPLGPHLTKMDCFYLRVLSPDKNLNGLQREQLMRQSHLAVSDLQLTSHIIYENVLHMT